MSLLFGMFLTLATINVTGSFNLRCSSLTSFHVLSSLGPRDGQQNTQCDSACTRARKSTYQVVDEFPSPAFKIPLSILSTSDTALSSYTIETSLVKLGWHYLLEDK